VSAPRHAKCLGFVACDSCGRELADAPDKAAWVIVVNLGVLLAVRCPKYEGRRP
jgi:hypothetical protein